LSKISNLILEPSASLEEKLNDADRRSVDALKLGNHNEQYSRKYNIRMLNFPERKDENLREDFVELVNTELKVHISLSDVQAIHRIPGKDRGIRPGFPTLEHQQIFYQHHLAFPLKNPFSYLCLSIFPISFHSQ
jgi:hypothetical protein